MFVLDAEELEDDFAPAVGTKRSDNSLMAPVVQPGHRGFAGRPHEGHNRQRRAAFFAGEISGMQSLRLGEQRTYMLGVCLEALRERIPVAHFGNQHLNGHG